MKSASTDKIEKCITLNADPDKVWAALRDARAFGTWFGAEIEGDFAPGSRVSAVSTHPECAGARFEMQIEAMDPGSRFAFRWHPHDVNPEEDLSAEPTTLVEFLLEPAGSGTQLTVIESGFDALPASRRELAFTRNEGGWTIQIENVRKHVDG